MSISITTLLLMLPGAFFAPVLHEFVKARVSSALGDKTPKHNGFITWNPFKFFEPIGFIFMLIFRVGWGQPVTTSPFYYKDKRKGIILTYTAPIIANLLVGMLTIFLLSMFKVPLLDFALRISVNTDTTWPFRAYFHLRDSIYLFGLLNIRLAVFNLIPVYPLAMNKMINVFISPETSMSLNHNEKIMQILLIILLLFGVVNRFVSPVSNIFVNAVSF